MLESRPELDNPVQRGDKGEFRFDGRPFLAVAVLIIVFVVGVCVGIVV